MIKLYLQPNDDVVTAISKIKSITDLNIEVNIPKESVLFENSLNIKLIQYEADKMEKSIDFATDDEIGNSLLSSVIGGGPEQPYIEEDQTLIEATAKQSKQKVITLPMNIFKSKKINIAPLNFIRKLTSGKKKVLTPVLILLTLLASFIFYGLKAPKASVKISVHSQALTKSVTIKVKNSASTSVQNKVLRGTTIATNIESTLEKDTTGTKTVGEKAEGEITLYNKTSKEISLDKGDKVVYEGKSTDLNYYLKDDVDIPASTENSSNPEVNIAGEATVDIIASSVGESFNIDDGKSLEVSGYKKSELAAKTKSDIDGGKSEEVKIVTSDDRNNISTELKLVSTKKAEEDIKSKLGIGQKLVAGSTQVQIIKDSFTKNIGDEAEKISLTQTVSGEGLAYMESELNKFIDEYVKDVIPEGFALSEQDREVKVEVLGSSTSSVLTSQEADIQVTLKTFIVPNINEEDIKNQLRGKSAAEAQSLLGSIKNVNSYEFRLSPAVPFFRNIPKDISRIQITIEKE
ncbi:hypothetical protein GYA37_02720 [candidate division WWE3 bacterium]|uniref:Baseplate protein J-like domain-containing protein n=1 Tax=candidate division WWE3 bacterium TaxID=2053526 RepID=A0A7X9E744_UNCKA|nr:hypothetical protein [candidate division WWE3 bacterium]